MKDIFSHNKDISRNAYLNWRIDENDQASNLFALASDYSDGAISLINSILEDNRDKKADALIMPILCCINHAIEVYMKAILRTIEVLNGASVSDYNTHNIKALYGALLGHIKKVSAKTSGLDKHLRSLDLYIDELYSKIQITNAAGVSRSGIDFARYPISADGTPHFYVNADENVVIDVENLGVSFNEIRGSLEALYLMYNAKAEALNE
jgi:hypothetical protein